METMVNQQQQHIDIKDIEAVQQRWADAVIAIGQAYIAEGDYAAVATKLIHDLYAYDTPGCSVMFKPTRAAVVPFRDSFAGALSYFIGGNAQFAEDIGFALEPWVAIRFDNHALQYRGEVALVMGEYHFTSATGNQLKAEYSLAYIKDAAAKLKIILHHSSLPYSPP